MIAAPATSIERRPSRTHTGEVGAPTLGRESEERARALSRRPYVLAASFAVICAGLVAAGLLANGGFTLGGIAAGVLSVEWLVIARRLKNGQHVSRFLYPRAAPRPMSRERLDNDGSWR